MDQPVGPLPSLPRPMLWLRTFGRAPAWSGQGGENQDRRDSSWTSWSSYPVDRRDLQHHDFLTFGVRWLSGRSCVVWASGALLTSIFELGMLSTVRWFDFSAQRANHCRSLSIYRRAESAVHRAESSASLPPSGGAAFGTTVLRGELLLKCGVFPR